LVLVAHPNQRGGARIVRPAAITAACGYATQGNEMSAAIKRQRQDDIGPAEYGGQTAEHDDVHSGQFVRHVGTPWIDGNMPRTTGHDDARCLILRK
jgi:hypothetical protein